jgi:cytochrome c oxidase subunit IV
VLLLLVLLLQEAALRNDTVVCQDEAAALHVAVNRAEAWARLAAARAALLPDLATSLQALATFEGSYAYGGGGAAATAALAASKVRGF